MRGEDTLVKVFHEVLKPMGFRYYRRNWYRLTEGLYSIVNIQRSEWYEERYVNLGFAPPDFVRKTSLSQNDCPVIFRWGSISSTVPEDEQLLKEDGIRYMSDEELWEALARRVRDPVVEIFRLAVDMEGLKEVLRSKVKGGTFIHKDIRPLLE